jgi:hypothetical protein
MAGVGEWEMWREEWQMMKAEKQTKLGAALLDGRLTSAWLTVVQLGLKTEWTDVRVVHYNPLSVFCS